MKVALLNPPSKKGEAVIRDNIYGCFVKSKAQYLWPPINLALLGAILKQAGSSPILLDAISEKLNIKKITAELKKINPKYVIIVTAMPSFNSDLQFISKLKKVLPQLRAIFIGNYVTMYPEKCLKNDLIDYLILGEPEITLKKMFQKIEKNLSFKTLKGIAFKKNGKIINNGLSGSIEDLDNIPFADRSLIPKVEYFNPLVKKLPYTTMNTSRGCPFPCIYCSAGLTYGKKYRFRSAKNVVDEIELCIKDI